MDILDKAMVGMEFRQDRGPKGGFRRTVEAVREQTLGKEQNRGPGSAQPKAA